MMINIRTEAANVATFLRQQRIAARIVGGFTAPAFYVYSLEIDPAEKITRIGASLDAMQTYLYNQRARAGVVDVNDPGQRVVVRFSDQPPALEISRPQPDRLNLSTMPLDRLAPLEALAGITFATKSGQPVVWRLDDPGQPHALVAGMSGSGKSNLMLSLIFSLCHSTDPDNLSIFVGDGGNSSLLLAKRLFHVADVESDAPGIAGLVAHVAGIVQQRKRASDANPEHRVLLVVDELANLLTVMTKIEAQNLHLNLATIAAEGRKFGVHLLAATQKPLAEVTGSLTKSNFAVRFVGAVTSKEDSNTALSVAAAGAERLAGRGDFIVKSGMFLRRFQAPYVDQEISTMRQINSRWKHAANNDALHSHVARIDTPAPQGSTPALLPVVEQESAPVEDEIGRIAIMIRPLWEQGASKSAMTMHALSRPYAGSYALKINRALALLESSTTTTTPPAERRFAGAWQTEDRQSSSSRALPEAKILKLGVR